MSIYNIAGILIDFTYQYQEFFKDNIEKYQVDDQIKADYMIKTETLNIIKHPSGIPIMSYKNRSVFDFEDKLIIVVWDKAGEISELIEHTKDYKRVHIILSSHLDQRLAEKEYLLTGQIFIELAALEHRLAIHGSAFMINDEAIVIAASSGMGKSTFAEYWKEEFDTFKVINDDKPLIHIDSNIFYVSGTPWSGKTKLNNNLTVVLKAIVFYHQDERNFINEISTDEKLKQLMNHALRPRGEILMNHALSIMDQLIRHCRIVEYHATNSPSSVYPLYEKIYGGHI